MNVTGRLHDDRGFSLLELVIVALIASGISGVLYSVFSIQGSTIRREQGNAVAQDRARIAIDEMVRSLQMAGFDPTGAGTFGFLEATGNRVRFTADADQDGALDSNPRENGGFRLQDGMVAEWRGGSSWRRLVSDVEALEFTYLDAFGAPTTIEAAIREITIALTVRSTGKSPAMEPRSFVVRGRVYLRNRA